MKSLKKETGFTLLEILIAIAILAFGLLAVATMQATAVKGNSQAIGITEGINLAQDKIEELIVLDYSHPDLSDTDNNGTNQDADADGVDDNGGNFGLDDTVDGGGNVIADNWATSGRYTVYWNVAVNQPINNTKTIRVIVQWTDRQASKRAAVDFMKADII
jgi:prepilin-type N-terminal cleavage/methylation domain-containing protein